MHLKTLVETIAHRPPSSVPDWMLGTFKRRSIAFANGQTDTDTHVFWLQSRNITIDLRLPLESGQVTAKSIEACSEAERRILANYEGWYAESLWQAEGLSWQGGTAFQVHNRWPEPAELKRVGDCMIEFAPSGIYVEDWRLLSRTPGPLIGLRLIDEVEVATGVVRHRGGALIVNGDWAGLVLGRPQPIDALHAEAGSQLRDRVARHGADAAYLQAVFQFETSVGQGNLQTGYRVQYSGRPERRGQSLFDLEGFEFDAATGEVTQRFVDEGRELLRRFTIDTLEPVFAYSPETPTTAAASDWFASEQETLGRYLRDVTA